MSTLNVFYNHGKPRAAIWSSIQPDTDYKYYTYIFFYCLYHFYFRFKLIERKQDAVYEPGKYVSVPS